MPECNAYVERFRGLCDQFFWTRHRFPSPADITQPYSEFLQTFRQEHTQGPTWTRGKSLPLVTGRVHCLCRTDSQARLKVLGRYFTLEAKDRRTYIRATLTVADQQAAFYYQEAADQEPELVGTRPFPLTGSIEPWDASLYLKYLT